MINILRGQTKAIKVKLRGKTSGDPLPLTGATEIVMSLPLEAVGTFLLKKLSLAELSVGTDDKLGIVSLVTDLTTVETLTLNPDSAPQEMKLTVTKGADVKIYSGLLLLIQDP